MCYFWAPIWNPSDYKFGEYECRVIAQYFAHKHKTQPVLFSKILDTHVTWTTRTLFLICYFWSYWIKVSMVIGVHHNIKLLGIELHVMIVMHRLWSAEVGAQLKLDVNIVSPWLSWCSLPRQCRVMHKVTLVSTA